MLDLLFTPSTLLTDEYLQEIYREGKVIELDERGPKVIRLPNGDFLKIFRTRRLFSGARIYSHARRFYRNAERLKALQIPTVAAKSLHHLTHSGGTAIIYQPLAGQTLRQLIATDLSRLTQLAYELGTFLATLHDKGIHFHSLHSGNILLTPEEKFGLIDISDMSIYSWSLMCSTRIRSFVRFGKYREEMAVLNTQFWQKVMHGYQHTSAHAEYCAPRIVAAIDYLHERSV
jgi:tRNA A-37 threonylcarbamoyl transferase component Bud32